MDVESVIRNHEADLMQLPNVTGLAPGERGGKPVIKVLVTHKVPESALQSHEVIPRSVDGIETEVEEVGVVTIQPS